jgi:hypothetical protein
MATYPTVVLATPNLAAYWKLAELSGTVADDSGPNNLDLTYTGTPTFGADSLLPNVTDKSVEFNGSTQYAVRAVASQLQGGSALTVEMWVRPDATGNRSPLAFHGSGTDKAYWFNMSSPASFYISNDGSAQIGVSAVTPIIPGNVYQIVGTYDGQTSKIYINGVYENQNTAPSGALDTVTTANSFAIGRLGANNADYFDGRMAHVSIYNRVLTDAEIAEHYAVGMSDPVVLVNLGLTGRRGLALITPKLMIADKLNVYQYDMSQYLQGGAVEMRTNRRVKMRFSGRLRDPSVIRPFTDYLAPILKIVYSDGSEIEQQLGLFSFPPGGEESSYFSSTGSFEAFDLGWNLSENTFGTYYSLTAGENVVDEVIAILAGEGFTRVNIVPSAATFPKSRTYDINRDKWNVCNAMLRSINYYHLWVDLQGVITSMPYQDYDEVEPAKYLFAGKGGEVVGTVRREPLKDQIYNKVRVVGERPKTNTPIIQTLTNTNPLSPTSTVNLGRTRMHPVIKDSDINSSAAALELARHTLQMSSSLYNRYEIFTLPDPGRGFFEVYDASLFRESGATVMEGRYRVSGWDIAFDPHTPMRHHLARLEAYLP